jgi:hypothetical protein
MSSVYLVGVSTLHGATNDCKVMEEICGWVEQSNLTSYITLQLFKSPRIPRAERSVSGAQSGCAFGLKRIFQQ